MTNMYHFCHLRNIYSSMLCIKISNKDILQRLARGLATCLDYGGHSLIFLEFQLSRYSVKKYLQFSLSPWHSIFRGMVVKIHINRKKSKINIIRTIVHSNIMQYWSHNIVRRKSYLKGHLTTWDFYFIR